MHMWAICYADLNRINVRQHDGETGTMRAMEIHLKRFLPSDDDNEMLRERMETIVARIVCKYVPYFRDHYGTNLPEDHFKHEYIIVRR